MVLNNFIRLVLSFTISYGAGYFASLYAVPLIPGWYSQLNKPGFLPPDPFLVPIGCFMYFLLGLALYFIWSTDGHKESRICLYLFVVGLVLNVLWFYAFFGLQSLFIAFVVSIMLLGIVFSLTYQAFHVSIPACILLVPYAVICLTLTIVNYLIYIMNPNLPILVL